MSAYVMKLEWRVAELERRIENAVYAATDTQPTWGYRFHRIMAALGHNFGDPQSIDRVLVEEVARPVRYELEDARSIIRRLLACYDDAPPHWPDEDLLQEAHEFVNGGDDEA